MGHVHALFCAPRRSLAMESLLVAETVPDVGFAGCAHARPGSERQVLIVDKETLDALELSPGIIRENITTGGVNVNGLEPGTCLRIGDVLLQVAMHCTPSSHRSALLWMGHDRVFGEDVLKQTGRGIGNGKRSPSVGP